ncbi:Cdc27 ubiquitin-protein ligase [Candida orthopsilosis Co 90-125]|uniref:Cdc27 ubiquitin-protein ligase n=1 Tax=Candida orthopsilosis (strain 90-125) TaxID=1136231 RepID=H8WW82_CANO9|nr:Cdc27 ubiquitin-protein ligase [Candida orthopsilosis Co 90-125]CCG20706.1 Cdc27 ubiquitin-protein ligase [Candida orthopsilosis Co 90-125]
MQLTDTNADPELPNIQYTQHYLRSIIIHSIDTFNYQNAEFASERLLAQTPLNLDSIYLYCLTLYHQSKLKSCYRKLIEVNNASNLNHLGCSYIFGKCCLQLNKSKDGIFQLLKVKNLYNGDGERINLEMRFDYENGRSILPDASSMYHLLGDLYHSVDDIKNSCLNYTQCLKLNQFDFEAFQKLCKMGVDMKVKSLYKMQKDGHGHMEQVGREDILQQQSQQSQQFKTPQALGTHDIPDLTNPFTDKKNAVTSSTTKNPSNTPTIHVDEYNFSTPRIKTATVPDAPLKKSNLNTGSHANHHDVSNTTIANNTFEFVKPNTTGAYPEGGGKKRGSRVYSKITSRLISQPSSHATINNPNETPNNNNKKNLKRNNSITSDDSSTGGTGLASAMTTSSSIAFLKEIEKSEAYLLHLYSIFARSFKLLSNYDCYKAIKLLEIDIPQQERDTPWVLSKLGKLHYEVMNYKQSEQYFKKLRKLDRARCEDMEVYSTLLWHLHKKVELTFLANELHDIDPTSPITWCTIGNLFSLTHEPDEAIRCFNKAIKLNDKFTYAHTLKGHEYFANDNYEMAMESFRLSLLLDPRHFNALYGIGMIYMNLGEYQKADYHFRKAISINPINIILICCVGMVLEKLNKKPMALKQYELACKLQPTNPLPIFKKAQLLFSLQNYPLALKNFEILKNIAPNEASVHFLLGQLYNLQQDKYSAIREFTIALNLDPKGNYLIKEAMESLNG